MTIEQFAYFVYRTTGVRPTELRLGQWMFNELRNEFPDIAGQIIGTEYDPFYVDSKIPAFLKRVLDFVKVNSDAR